MTRRLPSLNAKQVIRVLERADFFIERSSGSHYLLVHRTDPRRRVTVAYHGSRDIPRATLARSSSFEPEVWQRIDPPLASSMPATRRRRSGKSPLKRDSSLRATAIAAHSPRPTSQRYPQPTAMASNGAIHEPARDTVIGSSGLQRPCGSRDHPREPHRSLSQGCSSRPLVRKVESSSIVTRGIQEVP